MFQVPPTLLTTAEVAAMFQVDPKTVRDWADAGKLSMIQTTGGHRRYLRVEVEDLLHSRRKERDNDA